MDTSNRRIEWIDIAKGIGILLVILGHTIALSIVRFYIHFICHYSFYCRDWLQKNAVVLKMFLLIKQKGF